jgi:DNA polymerase III epsilon subunit-like protein
VDIIELAAATAEGQQFSSLVSPLTLIPPDAARITGLSWQDLQDQPPLPVVLLKWVQWLQQQCASTPGGSSTLVLMGHNISRYGFWCLCIPVRQAYSSAWK